MHALLLLSSSAGNLHIYLACDNTCGSYCRCCDNCNYKQIKKQEINVNNKQAVAQEKSNTVRQPFFVLFTFL